MPLRFKVCLLASFILLNACSDSQDTIIKKKDPEYIEFENGNHHLQIEKHRLAALTAIEKFLNKHIGKPLPVL